MVQFRKYIILEEYVHHTCTVLRTMAVKNDCGYVLLCLASSTQHNIY